MCQLRLSRAGLAIAAIGWALTLSAPSPAAGPGAPLHGTGALDELGSVRDDLEAEGWLVHGQTTYVLQDHPRFRSPYTGPDSLTSDTRARQTLSADAVFGRRLWNGAEFYVSPELDVGSGLNSSTGVAGALNNEAFRLASDYPKITIPRLFIRQVIGFGGVQEHLDGDQLQFDEMVDVERLTVTAGKISVWDIFDDNAYAHDARTQFLNWALVGNGAVDFAADARGFTPGVALDYNRADWAVRTGVFQVSRDVNGKNLDDHILDGYQVLLEIEERFQLFDRPGKLRELGMVDRTRAIDYQTSYGGLTGVNAADPLPGFRRYRENGGLGLNLEQEVADELGLFSRLGWNPGRVQEFMYTEIDWHASLGLSLKGGRWSRPDDTVGLAGLVNGLSDHHRRFLEAGNTGFIVGDGRLNYATEQVVETYYDVALLKGANLAVNYAFVNNPGYNADRGPASVFSLRLHVEF